MMVECWWIRCAVDEILRNFAALCVFINISHKYAPGLILQCYRFNALKPSGAYMRLAGAKPLSEPNAGILLIGPLGTNFSKILIEILTFSLKKMHLKMSSAKWRSFCLGPNVLIANNLDSSHAHIPMHRGCFNGIGTMVLPQTIIWLSY